MPKILTRPDACDLSEKIKTAAKSWEATLKRQWDRDAAPMQATRCTRVSSGPVFARGVSGHETRQLLSRDHQQSQI